MFLNILNVRKDNIKKSERQHYKRHNNTISVNSKKNLTPNRLCKDVLEKLDNDLSKFSGKVNADLCSHILADAQNIITETNTLIASTDRLIVAKAWRSIKISENRTKNTYNRNETDRHYTYQHISLHISSISA